MRNLMLPSVWLCFVIAGAGGCGTTSGRENDPGTGGTDDGGTRGPNNDGGQGGTDAGDDGGATDPCLSLTCGDNSTCGARDGVSRCWCDQGYQDNNSDQTCEPDCESTTCTGGTCDDSTGTAICTCDSGSQDNDGDGVCAPDCANSTCVGGTCDDSSGTAICTCPPGSQDSDGDGVCDTDCASTVCTGGTCDDSSGLAICTCNSGSQDNDSDGVCTPDCANSTCNNGTCDDSTGTAICTCNDPLFSPPDCSSCIEGHANPDGGCVDCDTGYVDFDQDGACTPDCGGGTCDGLHAARDLETGTHDFVLRDGTVGLHVDGDTDGGAWILIGRGREGWAWTNDGTLDWAAIKDGIGTSEAFEPAYLASGLIQGLIDNTVGTPSFQELEIRLARAANTEGTEYQRVDVVFSARTAWTWLFDVATADNAVTLHVGDSVLGAGASASGNFRDLYVAGNNYTRVFTWGWNYHDHQRGFSYGAAVVGVDSDDPDTFLWENTTEDHAIPYTEVYIRLPSCGTDNWYCNGDAADGCDDSAGLPVCDCAEGHEGDYCEICSSGYQDNDGDGRCEPACAADSCPATNEVCYDGTGTAECLTARTTTCYGILADDPDAESGVYALDLDDGDPNPVLVYCDMTTDGGGWTLILEQDTAVGYLPKATWAAGVNQNEPEGGQYSIANTLHLFQSSGGGFHLRMEWNNGDYVQWQQSGNPNVARGAVSNVVQSPANQSGCTSFGGLDTSHTRALYNGTTDGCWWWAVGSIGSYYGGIPAYQSATGSGELIASSVSLWVRDLPRSCAGVLDIAPRAEDGSYLIDPDGGRGRAPAFYAYCDMTTDGGGWTLCGNIDEVALETNTTCVEEGTTFIDDSELENASFCRYFQRFTHATNLMIHNRTPDGDDDYGEDDRLLVDWSSTPITPGTYSNTTVQCEHWDADGSTVTTLYNCRYASHAGYPWQNAVWSFTRNSVNNGYSGNFSNRVVLGPTYQDCDGAGTGGYWHSFTGGFHAHTDDNNWGDGAQNVGDLYLR